MPKGGIKYGSGSQTQSSHGSNAVRSAKKQGGKKGRGQKLMGNPHQRHSGPK